MLQQVVQRRLRVQFPRAKGREATGGQDPLGHAALPHIRMGKELREVVAGQLRQVHVLRRAGGHGLVRLITGPDDAPDAAAFAIDAGGVGVGVLVARILVIPVHHPHRSVRPGLRAHGHEPAVLGRQEIAAVGPLAGDETRALRREPVDVEGVLVDVPVQRRALPLGRPLVALIDVDARIGGHVVLVIHDARQLAVGVGEGRLAGLARVEAAGREVEQVVNDARAHEGVALAIKVHAPRVARALGPDLEVARLRVQPRDAGAHHDRHCVRIARVPGLGRGEDAVRHVKSAVRPPGEAVEQLVAVFEAEAGQHLRLFIGNIIAIGVAQEPQVRGLANIHPAVADEQAGGQRHAIGEDGHLVGHAVAIHVLEDLDTVAALLAGLGAERIFIELQHPQPPALVERHGDGVHHLRLAGEEAHLETGRHDERLLLVCGRQRGIVRRLVLAAELFARWRVGVDGKAEFGMDRLRLRGGGHGEQHGG